MAVGPQFWDEIFDPALSGYDSFLPFQGLIHALASRAEVIADIGCGRGWWAADGVYRPFFDLRGPGRTIVGIDLDPVGEENGNLDEFRLIGSDLRWPFEDESVDLAVSDFTLEHVEDPRAFVDELTRVLRPGGAFVARTVSRHSPLALAARVVPNAKHAAVIDKLQPGRQAADVFPTAYRMNSERDLRALFDSHYDWTVAHRAGFNQYFRRWPRLARTVAVVEPRLPKAVNMTLVVYARKRAVTT